MANLIKARVSKVQQIYPLKIVLETENLHFDKDFFNPLVLYKE
jgi:hypothetical protein